MQIKSLRIPKKNTGKHAGYAFIEFMTNQEAEYAKKELSSTHFYGRRFVSLKLYSCLSQACSFDILDSLYLLSFAGARMGQG